nr:MAG TPA: hypothetical protein [Caudoviricetes sp.]
MGDPQYIHNAVDGFESLYGEELTAQQRQNLVEALEYGETSLGVDADLATDALMVWGDYTGDLERSLDNVGELKTILLNYDGAHEYLGDYLKDLYIESLDLHDVALKSLALKPLDVEEYQRHLEDEGWVFASTQDGTLTYVFSA